MGHIDEGVESNSMGDYTTSTGSGLGIRARLDVATSSYHTQQVRMAMPALVGSLLAAPQTIHTPVQLGSYADGD